MNIDVSEVLKTIIEITVPVVGGFWILWNFVIQRESYSKIQFDADLKYLGNHNDELIFEITLIIENKGKIRQKIRNFYIDFFYVPSVFELKEDATLNNSLKFQPAFKGCYLVKDEPRSDNDYYFIDAGVTQRFTYTAKLPKQSVFAQVYSRFDYPEKKSMYHEVKKTFSIHDLKSMAG